MWVPRRLDRTGRDEMASNDLEVLFEKKKKNWWGWGLSEFIKPRASTRTERNKQKPKIVSSAKKNEVVRRTPHFSIADSKDYDIAERTKYYIQVNHMKEKPKSTNAEAEWDLKKANFNFMIVSETLFYATSVDPKLLHLKICMRNNQRERALEEISPVFAEPTKRFGFVSAGDKTIIPEELKMHVVEALHFRHDGSTKCWLKAKSSCGLEWGASLKTSIVHDLQAWIRVKI